MLKVLEAEAKESADKTIAEAQAQADETLVEAKKSGEKQAQKSLDKANQRIKLERAKALSNANFEVKKEVLKAQEEVIEQLFTTIKEEAKRDFGSDYELFKSLASEALRKFDGQEVKVLVNAKSKDLAERVMSELGENYKVEAGLNGVGGLKVSSADSRVTVDNTIESRLSKVRQLFEHEIIENLFGDEK